MIKVILIKLNVAINFSTPSAAVNNIIIALKVQYLLSVELQGGWTIIKVTQVHYRIRLLLLLFRLQYRVNLFLNSKTLAKIVQDKSDYKASIEEIHHIHKLDTPSGTAITLAEGILENSKFEKMV